MVYFVWNLIILYIITQRECKVFDYLTLSLFNTSFWRKNKWDICVSNLMHFEKKTVHLCVMYHNLMDFEKKMIHLFLSKGSTRKLKCYVKIMISVFLIYFFWKHLHFKLLLKNLNLLLTLKKYLFSILNINYINYN